MARSLLILSISLVSIFKLVESGGIDLGLCHDDSEACQCGQSDGHHILIPVKQCTYFVSWRPNCKDCDEIVKEVRCKPYAQCQDCAIDRCLKCPPEKYGKWCNLECRCKNGGICEQESGNCICPSAFHGPTCEESAMCPSDLFLNGDLDYNPREDSYQVGSRVTFSCNSIGTFLDGIPSVECLSSGQWSDAPPKCVSECPLVATPSNGSVHLPTGRLKVGVTASYSCNDNHQLVGDPVRTCQDDGTWTGNDPICERIITCAEFETLQFGNFSVIHGSSSQYNISGTTIAFTCNQGYILIGEEYIQCTEDGTWSRQPPVCAKEGTVCSSMGELKNGNYIIKGEGGPQAYLASAEIEFFCDNFYFLYGQKKATCLPVGTWSSGKPICIKMIACHTLDPLANGKMQIQITEAAPLGNPDDAKNGEKSNRMGMPGLRFNSSIERMSVQARTAMFNTKLPQGYYHIGTRAIISCESRYYELIGSMLRVCETTGEWSGRQATCIPICGRSNGPRLPFITHGQVSEMGQWPWQVALSYRTDPNDPESDWKIMCGASLISERWVVTAAHCVCYENTILPVPPDEIQLYFGKYFRDNSKDDNEVEIRKVREIHVHNNYEPTSFDSDIALLRLKEPVKLSSRVQPICLPDDADKSNNRLRESGPGVITGWGMTEMGNLSDVLLQATVPIVSNRKCEDDYRRNDSQFVITKNMICAGFEEGKRDACTGDSGGPLVFPLDERDNRWVLEGIVSWGSRHGCGHPFQYGGYVRVQKFISWIREFV